MFALKSFSIDSRRAFICAATLARDLNSCSAVSQRQCERARRSRTRHPGRYISCHGAKREPASRNTTRKTQCKTARSSRRPACLARAVRGLFACLGASQCYLEHCGGEVVAIFAFFSRLHFAGREERKKFRASLLLGVHSRPGNDACAATRQGDCRGRLPGPGSTDASGGGHLWAGIARCPASPSARRSVHPRRALDGRFACPRERPGL